MSRVFALMGVAEVGRCSLSSLLLSPLSPCNGDSFSLHPCILLSSPSSLPVVSLSFFLSPLPSPLSPLGGPLQCLPLNAPMKYTSPSEVVWSGVVGDETNSCEVRALLLEEILVRTLKNLLRLYMRVAHQKSQVLSLPCVCRLVAHFFNLVTGSAERDADV